MGSCFAGQCQVAEALISGLPTLANIATDGTTLFFASGGHAGQFYLDSRLLSIPNTGAATAFELAGTYPSVEAVALDGDDVLFSSTGTQAADGQDGFIGRVAKGGGIVETVAAAQSFSSQIVVEGGDYYWVSAGSWSGNFDNGTVNRLSGSAVTLVAGLTRPSRLAVDATHVYWTSGDGPDPDGVVARVPVAGGAVEILATGLENLTAIAVVDGLVYFGTEGVVNVLDPTNPGSISIFEATLSGVSMFAADGPMLYWTEGGSSGRVVGKSVSGGDALVLTDGHLHPYGITTDASYVYFTQRGTGVDDGVVYRIHR